MKYLIANALVTLTLAALAFALSSPWALASLGLHLAAVVTWLAPLVKPQIQTKEDWSEKLAKAKESWESEHLQITRLQLGMAADDVRKATLSVRQLKDSLNLRDQRIEQLERQLEEKEKSLAAARQSVIESEVKLAQAEQGGCVMDKNDEFNDVLYSPHPKGALVRAQVFNFEDEGEFRAKVREIRARGWAISAIRPGPVYAGMQSTIVVGWTLAPHARTQDCSEDWPELNAGGV